jgi:hypothetical protein
MECISPLSHCFNSLCQQRTRRASQPSWWQTRWIQSWVVQATRILGQWSRRASGCGEKGRLCQHLDRGAHLVAGSKVRWSVCPGVARLCTAGRTVGPSKGARRRPGGWRWGAGMQPEVVVEVMCGVVCDRRCAGWREGKSGWVRDGARVFPIAAGYILQQHAQSRRFGDGRPTILGPFLLSLMFFFFFIILLHNCVVTHKNKYLTYKKNIFYM